MFILILLVLYAISIVGCIDPMTKRTEPNIIALLIIFTPIVNTVYAIIFTDWTDVKKMFKK